MWVTKAAIKMIKKNDKKASYKKDEVEIILNVAFSL